MYVTAEEEEEEEEWQKEHIILAYRRQENTYNVKQLCACGGWLLKEIGIERFFVCLSLLRANTTLRRTMKSNISIKNIEQEIKAEILRLRI